MLFSAFFQGAYTKPDGMKNTNENIVIKPEVNIQVPAQSLTDLRPQAKTTVNNANTELQALQAQMMNSFNMFFRLLAQYRDGMQMRVRVWWKSKGVMEKLWCRLDIKQGFLSTTCPFIFIPCFKGLTKFSLPLPCLVSYVLHSSNDLQESGYRLALYKQIGKQCGSKSAGFWEASRSGSTLFSKQDIFIFSMVRVEFFDLHAACIIMTNISYFWINKYIQKSYFISAWEYFIIFQ